MTTAWGVGVSNLIVNGVLLLAALCTFATGVALLTGRTFLASLDPAFTLLASLCILVGAVFWLYGRRVGGRILLDCGPRSYRNLILLLAAWYLIPGLWGVATAKGISSLAETAQELVFAALLLFVAFGRLQITENGIWEYDSLLRWNKIASHRWTDDGTLILHTKGWLTMLRRDLTVPPQQRNAVNAYLLERTPLNS